MAVRVEIYESRIVAHFTPGGVVYRNGSRLGNQAQNVARVLAPRRTGNLIRSITHGIAPRGLHLNVNLVASAHYAPYVEHGTVGPIVPRHSPVMPIPAFGPFSAFAATSVSGQSGQHFLQRGMNRALNTLGYASIPGEF